MFLLFMVTEYVMKQENNQHNDRSDWMVGCPPQHAHAHNVHKGVKSLISLFKCNEARSGKSVKPCVNVLF